MRDHGNHEIRGEGAIKAIIGIAFLVVTAIACVKIIPLHVHGGEVFDAMNEQASFAGVKPLDKIQYEVFRVAQEAIVPLPIGDIKVTRSGTNVTIAVKYEQAVDVLGYHYVYHFDKKVVKTVF